MLRITSCPRGKIAVANIHLPLMHFLSLLGPLVCLPVPLLAVFYICVFTFYILFSLFSAVSLSSSLSQIKPILLQYDLWDPSSPTRDWTQALRSESSELTIGPPGRSQQGPFLKNCRSQPLPPQILQPCSAVLCRATPTSPPAPGMASSRPRPGISPEVTGLCTKAMLAVLCWECCPRSHRQNRSLAACGQVQPTQGTCGPFVLLLGEGEAGENSPGVHPYDASPTCHPSLWSTFMGTFLHVISDQILYSDIF